MSSRRRHSTGFGYIGFGNSQATFNQRSSKPFSKYKDKLDLEAHLHYKMHFLHKDLTREDKQKIKNKIRQQERKLLKRTVIISTILFIIIAVTTFYLITKILSH
ncbi:hypothetical protein KO504_04775 [Winogradskyella psychrotolerans]|uniref:hypothetical protein n=1 Tax=Winogradskyella psychrotolerans TaxID=1344585 RepID=UPI001C0652E7|nr:hypothetical protein [Winogradskyella psychrotolerans]MBU2920643.1 hypothetical protein [Winogradskyella psychrotolerans]